MFRFLQKFRYFDIPLQMAILLLLIAGLALLYSISLGLGGDSGPSIIWRQLIFAAAGLAGYFFFAFFDYHTLAKANRLLYLGLVLLLTYLITFGALIRGGKRWIDLGFFRIQPAEFAKIIIILGLARLFYLRRGQINSWSAIFWSLAYVLVPVGLILLEPDLGSAMVLLAIWAGILLITSIQKKFILMLLLAFVLISGAAWKFALKDFQRSRIEVFLNPELDPRGKGYNVRQAVIAVGSGQLLGSGLGKGMQTQDNFIPERQTDFIFAASSEETGFVGSAAILAVYLFLLYRLLVIAKKAKDDLGMYIAGGTFFFLFCHVIINIGMNIGLLPVTGIPLPFISSGGSSLMVTLIALGVVQNVSQQSKALRF